MFYTIGHGAGDGACVSGCDGTVGAQHFRHGAHLS